MALAGDNVQVLVGQSDLTGDINKIAIDDRRDSYDVSGFGDFTHNFILGKRMASIEHSGYMNAVSGTHGVLRTGDIQRIVSVLLGLNAAPAVGNPVYSMLFQQGKYAVMPEVNKYIPFAARFDNAGSNGGWGVILTPPVTMTNTTSGSSVDNGAPTTKGRIRRTIPINLSSSIQRPGRSRVSR
jgi:hypothetical protein